MWFGCWYLSCGADIMTDYATLKSTHNIVDIIARRVELTPKGILIKAIHLHDENGEYIRDAKLNGQLLCTLTEHLLKITICK